MHWTYLTVLFIELNGTQEMAPTNYSKVNLTFFYSLIAYVDAMFLALLQDDLFDILLV